MTRESLIKKTSPKGGVSVRGTFGAPQVP